MFFFDIFVPIFCKNGLRKRLFIALCLLPLCATVLRAGNEADSLMSKLWQYAPAYEKHISEYKAKFYVKCVLEAKKRNKLYRYIPHMVSMRGNRKKHIIETFSELHYTAPRIYDQKITSMGGTTHRVWKGDGRMPDYFHINVYSSALMYDKLISPLAQDGRKYYRYEVDSVWADSAGMRHVKIGYEPRRKSFQLVTGYLVLTEGVWSIRELMFSGKSEIFHYENHITMGAVGAENELLPVAFDLHGEYKVGGNVLVGEYLAKVNYDEIHAASEASGDALEKRSKYDLTLSYTLATDHNTEPDRSSCARRAPYRSTRPRWLCTRNSLPKTVAASPARPSGLSGSGTR